MMNRQKKKRIRGIILTPQGLQELQAARAESERKENYGERYTYENISELTNLDINTVKRVLTGKEGVDRRSLEKFLIAFKLKLTEENYTKPSPSKRQDWGEAVSIDHFFGRTKELEIMEDWLLHERCRLLALLGMGGIGKTTLSIKFAQQAEDYFDCVIWKSLRDIPPVKEIVGNLIKFLSEEKKTEANLPPKLGDRITILLEYLGSLRCLIILDNVESLLDRGSRAGKYLPGYEGYGELLTRVGATGHTSSIILTTREKPKEIAVLEGKKLLVRSLQLEGLREEGPKIFQLKRLVGSQLELKNLSDRYGGNPLALKVVATTIQDLFDGNIAEFLAQEQAIYGDIRDVLDQQFERLSDLEQEIMYWLAIAREPISVKELQEDFTLPISSIKLVEALEALSRRSLIENNSSRFTQQPVVMEYVTSQLIGAVCQEIQTQQLKILRDHALIKATAKDYIRENQIRLILQPVINGLLNALRSREDLEVCLRKTLVKMQQTSPPEKWYAAGNIINLFCQLKIDLTGYDFSNLCIWQADLRQARLHKVNFQNSDLSRTVFAENFGGVWSVAFSPDGQYLAAGDTKGNILLRRGVDGQPIKSFEGHTGWVVSLAFSPDGNTLASGSCDCTAKLWNANTGQCLHTLEEHRHEVWSVAFSPDGQTLATGCDDSQARLWNVKTGECIRVFQGHTSQILSVTFSLDGQYLVSGSEDKTIRFWNVASGNCEKIFRGHDEAIRSVVISPDGLKLASGGNDQTIRLWDIDTGACLKIFKGHDSMIMAITFNWQSNILASSSFDQTIRLWNIDIGECIKVLPGHSSYINSVKFSPQENLLISGSNDQTVRLWNIDQDKCLKTFQGYCNQVLSLTFNRDGKTLLGGGHDHTIRFWNIETGQIVKALQEHTNWVLSVAFSPKDNLLASGSKDKSIRIWDVNAGKIIKILWGHEGTVFSVAFSPDGKIIASSSEDRTIRLWDTDTGKVLKILNLHQGEIWSTTFNADGEILASASFDQTIRLWDVSTGKCLQTLKDHQGWVWSVAFSPNSYILVSTSSDQTIRIWDTNTGKCLRILKENIGYSHLVIFSPDGQTIASCDGEHHIKLWNVNNGRCFKIISGHQALINAIAFSPDGQTLVSSSEDETIKVWNLIGGNCIKTIAVKKAYENMNIIGVTALASANIESLKALGASVY